jgi:hypothetical protein
MILKNNPFCFIAVILIITAAYSQPPNYWENFKINESDVDWYGAYPVVAPLNNGNLVFCWKQNYDVIAGRIYNAELKPISPEFILNNSRNQRSNLYSPEQLNTEGTRDVYDHELAVKGLSNGDFVLFWQDYSDPLRGKIFSATGADKGIKIDIIPPYENEANHPSLALLRNGNFVVCWHLRPSAGAIRSGDSDGIYCKIFNKSGLYVSDAIKVNKFESSNEWSPTIAPLGDNMFVICWQDGLWDAGKANIYGQLFDYSGNKINGEFQVNSDTSSYNYDPYVKELLNNYFIVVWEKDYEICGQLFSSTGEKVNELFLISSGADVSCPTLSQSDNGTIIICWNEYGRIFGRLYKDSLCPFYDKFLIGYSTYQNYVKVESFKNGFILCWPYEAGENIIGRYLLNEPIVHEINLFALHEPANDKTIDTIAPTFIWEKPTQDRICYPFEMTYNLYIDQNDHFTDPIIVKGICDTMYKYYSLNSGQTYFWKIVARNIEKDSVNSSNINGFFIPENAIVAGENGGNSPSEFLLHQNFPNPFNSQTIIDYDLSNGNSEYRVSIKVFDLLGRFIKSLENTQRSPGTYSVFWDGTNENGYPVSSGIYYYTIHANEYLAKNKMLLLR